MIFSICLIGVLILGSALLVGWIIQGQQKQHPDANHELKKQIAWAKFKGQYELTETEWAILNLTDEFKESHGYNPDGTLKHP